jgi:FkbM family methyltransferase
MQSPDFLRIPRKVKRVVKSLIGKDFFPDIDYKCRYQTFGATYGNWTIAMEKINSGTIVYSFGVGENISFDLALIERFDLSVYAFDPTPKSIEWVKKQNIPHNFIMHEYGIANFDGTALFHPPENPDHVSNTILDRPESGNKAIPVPIKKLSTIMRELGHERVDILKMDIEGAEYNVIKDIEQSDIRPQQILIELHHRFPDVGIKKSQEAISTIKKMGYGLFYVSPSGEELSFYLKNE